jgi:chemotaxis protein methyltransferase CheR
MASDLPPELSQEILQEYRAVFKRLIGLNIRDEDIGYIFGKLKSRLRLLNLTTYESYLQMIQSETTKGEAERAIIGYLLTVGETYFMRHRRQIDFIKQYVLPRIVKECSDSRSLRIWSAGCSTGEEPYTIAILLDEVIADRGEWDIKILATDINPKVLHKAKEAIYPSSALKEIPIQERSNHFSPYQGFWKLREDLQDLVTFCPHNLVAEPFNKYVNDGDECLENLDLIVCRNVFIYFDYETIEKVLQCFRNALKSDGYLIVGMYELLERDLPGFEAITVGEDVVYRPVER